MTNDPIISLIRRDESRRRWREDRRKAERILKRRRERYANDPSYQESIKASVRRQRKKKSGSDRRRSFNRDKLIVMNGISVTLLSSGKVASLLGVSARTIVNWEKKGYIPLNYAKDSLGRRWYPAEFVVFLIAQVVSKSGRLDEWSLRVKESWQTTQLSDRPIPIVSDYTEDLNV